MLIRFFLGICLIAKIQYLWNRSFPERVNLRTNFSRVSGPRLPLLCHFHKILLNFFRTPKRNAYQPFSKEKQHQKKPIHSLHDWLLQQLRNLHFLSLPMNRRTWRMIIMTMSMTNQQIELTSDVWHQQFRQISHGHKLCMKHVLLDSSELIWFALLWM